jgi:hypothetical protein
MFKYLRSNTDITPPFSEQLVLELLHGQLDNDDTTQTYNLKISLLHLRLCDYSQSEKDSISLLWTLNVDALRMPSVHLCGHLDPMETIKTRGAHEYSRLEPVAMKTNGDVLAVAGSGNLGR